jgi:serine/threonine-protein kinase RsbW
MTGAAPPDVFVTLGVVLPSSAEHLALLRSCVRWFCDRADIPEPEMSRTVLCVVEAVTNIIRHAYGGDPRGTIAIELRATRDGVEFEFVDEGRAVSPAEVESPGGRGDERGGRGISLIKTCMDGFHYEVRPQGGARLVLLKRRARSEAPRKE